MAVAIRAATESETFDLAGNSVSTIGTTIKSAFATPLELNDMIRLTFVTGAGKLGRSKYDDDAAKTVTSTLRELGYVDDRGASCVVECAGSFKSQHDTGKNLKTIVVFPLIQTLNDTMGDLALGDGQKGPAILEDGSPKQLLAMASMNTFERMLISKCPSWSQKKVCVAVIEEVKAIVQGLDNNLMQGTPLTDSEQEFYDECDLTSLENKENYTKSEMQKHVEEGKITPLEKKKLLAQVQEKLAVLEGDIKDATENQKPKKLQKSQAQKQKLTERVATLDAIKTCMPHPLKQQPAIEKLRKEMQPLLKLEKETKGRLLSIKETTAMGRKDEIEDEILYFEEDSRGWFEEDEDFQLRIDASRALARTKAAAAKKTVKKSSAGSAANKASTPINWVLPGAPKRTTRPAAKKKATNTNAFAAMMDSDSD